MEGIDRDTLMAVTKNYFEANSYDTDWDALENKRSHACHVAGPWPALRRHGKAGVA